MLAEFTAGLLSILFDPTAMLWCLLGVFLGTIVGALPGLGPTTGIVVLLPLTFQIDQLSALILLMSVYLGAMYGGRISSILINVPGDAAAIVSTFDGYPLSQQGRAGFALSLSAIASFFGGLVGIIGMIFLTTLLTKVALAFTPMDYFSLMVFTLISTCGLVQKKPFKPIIAVFIGLMISTIGTDVITGVQRLTFGSIELWDGIHVAVLATGLFGLSEMLFELGKRNDSSFAYNTKLKLSEMFPKISEVLHNLGAMIRGSVIGFLVGILPGTGAVLATFLSYDVEKKISKNPDSFGKGEPKGLSTAESANNSSVGGALIPTFALGIPGSSAAAVLLGGLMMVGLQPGPLILENSGDVFWAALAGLFIANILLLILNTAFVPLFTVMIEKSQPYIVPLVATLCFVGVYFINNSLFDIGLMVLFGVFGYFLRKFGFPLAPLLLGFILGPMIEKNLRQSLLISNGDYSIFFIQPISLIFLILSALILILPFIKNKIKTEKVTNN